MILRDTKIDTDESMVEWDSDLQEMVPRKDALIYSDRIVCHPSMEAKVREGLSGFFEALNGKRENGN